MSNTPELDISEKVIIFQKLEKYGYFLLKTSFLGKLSNLTHINKLFEKK